MIPPENLAEHFRSVEHLEALGLADYETGAISAGAQSAVSKGDAEKHTGTPDAPELFIRPGQFMMLIRPRAGT